jgi:cytoskeletal protein CcmA (bactofilin family)
MKCRRSKTSRGARLRELAAAKLRKATHSTHQHADAASGREPVPIAGQRPEGLAATPTAELRIDGPTQGAINYEGSVIVGPHGEVKGDVSATTIVIEGQVHGDLHATQSLRIAAGGAVVGDLSAPRIGVARGARIQGRISTRGSRPHANGAELDEYRVAELLAGA